MCDWKQWRYARTKVRELMKLGAYRKTAIFVAISRKGPCIWLGLWLLRLA